jgi:hypothetical protein
MADRWLQLILPLARKSRSRRFKSCLQQDSQDRPKRPEPIRQIGRVGIFTDEDSLRHTHNEPFRRAAQQRTQESPEAKNGFSSRFAHRERPSDLPTNTLGAAVLLLFIVVRSLKRPFNIIWNAGG